MYQPARRVKLKSSFSSSELAQRLTSMVSATDTKRFDNSKYDDIIGANWKYSEISN